MKKAIIVLSIILGCSTFSKAQSSINDYKYVIVPNSFDFLKSDNQYQLNSLTKFLFEKNGFHVVMNNENFPEDLSNNRCLALQTDVKRVKGFLKTKIKVVLKNCNNEIIFISEIGETREKNYSKAYNFALRDAFNSIEAINYKYKPNENIVAKASNSNKNSNQEIEKLKEEIKTLKDQKSSRIKLPVKVKDTKIEIEEKAEDVKEEVSKTTKIMATKTKVSNVLYAQEIDSGFQVVDSTPKVIMVLLTTPKQDVFIVKNRSAIVYKEDGFWYLSEDNGTATTTKKLNIKF